MSPPPVHLETDRLFVTMPGQEAAAKAAAYVSRNQAHLGRWEPTHPIEFYTEDFWRDQLERNRREVLEDRSLRLVAFPKAPFPKGSAKDHVRVARPVIGFVNYTTIVRGAFHACFLGYSLDEGYQGRGLMTEALRASLKYVFDELGIHRVMANYLPENRRSAAVLARLGFVTEGFARDYLLIGGTWRDHVLTARTNPRWGAAGPSKQV